MRDIGYIEADFQREYGICLPLELSRMPWRRFVILVTGLSPNSVMAHVLAKRPIDLSNDPSARDEIIDRIFS